MLIQLILLYAAAGIIGGGLLGLLGVGCGIVCVPLLAVLLPKLGVPVSIAMPMAVTTSLAVLVPTTISSIYAHHKAGNVRWDIFSRMVGGSIFGALLGASTASLLPAAELKIIFGILATIIAIKMFFNIEWREGGVLPSGHRLLGTSGIIAYLASVAGLGGGVFTVPWLHSKKVNLREAVATSTALGFPISLTALITWCFYSIHAANLPAYSIGYLNVPAFLIITICSITSAQISTRLSHRISVKVLKKAFAIALFLAVCDLVLSH